MTTKEAIISVMLKQFKKDAKEAHAVVEAAGYTIYKNDGLFHVKNRKTSRDLCIKETYFGWLLKGNYGETTVKFNSLEDLKFDIEGYLQTPYKKDFDYSMTYRNKASMKYSTLQSIKSSVDYEDKKVNEILNKIKQLNEDLVWHTTYRERKKTELEALRKEYGLA